MSPKDGSRPGDSDTSWFVLCAPEVSDIATTDLIAKKSHLLPSVAALSAAALPRAASQIAMHDMDQRLCNV